MTVQTPDTRPIDPGIHGNAFMEHLELRMEDRISKKCVYFAASERETGSMSARGSLAGFAFSPKTRFNTGVSNDAYVSYMHVSEERIIDCALVSHA